MFHKHKVRIRFYQPNQVWIITQPGKDEDIFLYPNGDFIVGYDNDNKKNASDNEQDIEIGFE